MYYGKYKYKYIYTLTYGKHCSWYKHAAKTQGSSELTLTETIGDSTKTNF